MKREFTNENFEDFLKRSADGLRMKAPDRVWQNLSRELNKRRRRWFFGLGAFLLITTSTAGYLFISETGQEKTSVNPAQQQKQTTVATTGVNQNSNRTVQLSQSQNSLQPSLSLTAQNPLANKIAPVQQAFINTSNQNTIKNTINSDGQNISLANNFTATITDSYTEFDQQPRAEKTTTKFNELSTAALPLTIESVINSYKAKSRKSKLEKQFYFTPTISYRKLTENKSYLRTLDPATIPANLTAQHSSVNSNVTHKPDVGFELGFTAKIPLSAKLKVRSGLQFNVNRYDIKAFNSPTSIATIALNTGSGIDSLSRATRYSNISGYKSDWLQNLSFQLSMPIGVEYNFSSSDKLQFGVAGTIQPTYVLGDRAYLISTDYKSYTQVAWLVRRWNVNTAFETFVKYKNWQFGPQVRYQLLSSFDSKYPVKENLFDFGLKVGVTLK